MRIELSGAVAVSLAKSLDPARSKDAMRRHLTGVYWEMPYGETPVNVFTTTDGYRLHRVTIGDAIAIDAGLSGIAQSVTLSGDVVKALVAMAKLAGKKGLVVLDSDDGKTVVTAHMTEGYRSIVGSMNVETLYGDFPQCADIIARSNEIELPAFFNPKYLGDVIDAAGIWAGKDGLVRVDSLNVTKPGRIVSRNSSGTFTGVIMPARAPKVGE